MRRFKSGRLAVVALLGLATAFGVTTTASAHHTDNMFKTNTYSVNCSTSTLCRSDNSTLTFFRGSSLDATAKQNIWNVLYDKYNPTDLSVTEENPPVYTGGSETDMIYQIDGGIFPSIGRTVCDDPIDDIKCDQFYVKFVDNSWARNDAVACHETGHAVGLTHGAQAYPVKSNDDQSLECMATPSPYVLGSHSVPQINATY